MDLNELVTDRLQKAIALQKDNKLDEAEAIYEEILSHEREILAPESGNDPVYLSRFMADVHNNYGLIFYQRKEFREAASQFRSALDFAPGNMLAHINLAMVQQHRGNYDSAVEVCEQALSFDKNNLAAQFQLGRSLKLQGDLERAEKVFADILEREPKAEPLTEYGQVLAQLGRLEESLATYRKAEIMQQDLPGLQINIANVQYLMGQVEDAIATLQKVVEKNPVDPAAWSNMGMYLQRIGRAQEALKAYQESYRINPNYLENIINYANLLQIHKQYDGAWQLVEPHLATNLTNNRLQLVAAMVETTRGQEDAALERLEKLLFTPQEGHAGALVFYQLGKLYDRKGDYEKAFEAFTFSNKLELEIPSHRHIDGSIPFERVEELMTVDVSDLPKVDYDGRSPIFIMGFPMSGSGLLGTYLKMRSDVTVIDEVPLAESMARIMTEKGLSYPQDIAKIDDDMAAEMRALYWQNAAQFGDDGQKPLVDVFAFNTKDIALIGRVFPNAKIAYVSRHPMELIFSCFTHEFALNPITINFTNMEDGKKFYQALTRQWMRDYQAAHMDYKIIHFEKLISNGEAEVKDFCDYVGIEWQEIDHLKKMFEMGDTSYRYVNYLDYMVGFERELADIIDHFDYGEKTNG